MFCVYRGAVAASGLALRFLAIAACGVVGLPRLAVADSERIGGGPYTTPYQEGATRPLDGSPRSGVYSSRKAPRFETPSRRPAPPPERAYVPPAIWQGLYVGANAGYGWTTTAITGWNVPTTSQLGLQLGGHVGTNFQAGHLVLGLEADLMRDGSNTSAASSGASVMLRESWASTFRGRAGYAFDQALIYGTGGVAIGDQVLTVNSSSVSGTVNNMRFGIVFGAGVEYKLAPQISARLEALHYSYRESTVNWNAGAQGVKQESNTVRAGVSMHFN